MLTFTNSTAPASALPR